MNKQSEILKYINKKLTTEGYSPSVREIAKAVNLKSTSSVQYHLDNLIKKGLLTKKANLSRSLSNNQKLNTFMSVPVIGEISAGTPLLAEENKIGLYLRPKELATSKSLIDDYIYEYINSKKPAHLAVVNPTSPFISAEELDKAWLQYANSDCDTLLSCERIQTHCFKNGKAINFSINSKHPRSQDIEPIYALNFAISIWNCKSFKESFKKNGYGVYTGKLDFFTTSELASVDIDYPEDFRMAEYLAALNKINFPTPKAKFPEYVNKFMESNKNIQN